MLHFDYLDAEKLKGFAKYQVSELNQLVTFSVIQ